MQRCYKYPPTPLSEHKVMCTAHGPFFARLRYYCFLSQITLCFSFGLKDKITVFTCFLSYKYSSFTLWAYLCWRHTYCQWPIIELTKNVSPKNKIAASHVVQIHTHVCFPPNTKWSTYHVAVPTENALALQRSIFRENHIKFRPSSATEKVSIICGTNNHVKSEILSNRQIDRHMHRPSTVTLAAHTRWGLTMTSLEGAKIFPYANYPICHKVLSTPVVPMLQYCCAAPETASYFYLHCSLW